MHLCSDMSDFFLCLILDAKIISLSVILRNTGRRLAGAFYFEAGWHSGDLWTGASFAIVSYLTSCEWSKHDSNPMKRRWLENQLQTNWVSFVCESSLKTVTWELVTSSGHSPDPGLRLCSRPIAAVCNADSWGVTRMRNRTHVTCWRSFYWWAAATSRQHGRHCDDTVNNHVLSRSMKIIFTWRSTETTARGASSLI